MRNSIIEKYPCDERFPYSEKELECLAELDKMTDADIDFSDIPKITHEEFQRAIMRMRRKKNIKIAS